MKQYKYDVSQSAELISDVGIAQTVGMIGLGYLGDLSWMNINICYSLCMLGECLDYVTFSIYQLNLLFIIFFSVRSVCVLHAPVDYELHGPDGHVRYFRIYVRQLLLVYAQHSGQYCGSGRFHVCLRSGAAGSGSWNDRRTPYCRRHIRVYGQVSWAAFYSLCTGYLTTRCPLSDGMTPSIMLEYLSHSLVSVRI